MLSTDSFLSIIFLSESTDVELLDTEAQLHDLNVVSSYCLG